MNIDIITQPIEGINLEEFSAHLNRKINVSSLNGNWKFIYLDEMDDKYLEESFNINDLDDIKVPSHIEFNGYNNPQYVNMIYPWEGKEDLKIGEVPKYNPVGIYFKDIDSVNLFKEIYLEFEGFESCLFLYVNGKFVGYSTHNFTTSKFKLNEYLKEGKNRITVVVFKYSFVSWYTDQDMFRLSGINRPINLLSLDKVHFKDIHNKSILNDDYSSGLLDINFKLNSFTNNTYLQIEVSQNNDVIFNEKLEVNDLNVSFTRKIEQVKKWSDEAPNLYNVSIKLIDNDDIKEEVSLNVGFRRIEIKNGVMYLNNKRLILKGVNRHEFNCIEGRTMSKELIEEDIKFMKKHNINALRTSHYPNSHYVYELCDEYGIIVMDEAAIETHGTWASLECDNKEYVTVPGSKEEYKEFTLSRGRAMYERDKNYPSILFYSLGNESHAGKNLEALSNYFHEVDKTRLVHYEGCFHNKKYLHISDMDSRMYARVNEIRKFLKKSKNKPFVLCEFCHAMGNSLGNFDEYMGLIDEFTNYQGGFIWDFVDQGILKDNKMHFGGDFKDYPNDNNFCANGLLLADRRKTPKVNVVKYYYSNIQFNIFDNKIEVINKNSFIDTANIEFKYFILENGIAIYEESFDLNVAPLSKEEYLLKLNIKLDKEKEYVLAVGAYLKEDTLFASKGHEINYDYKFIQGALNRNNYQVNENKEAKFKVYKSVNHLTVENKDLKVIFKGIKINNGGLEAIIYKDKTYLDKVVFPTLFRPTTDNDASIEKYFNGFYLAASMYPLYNPFSNEIKVKSISDNKVEVEIVYSMIVGLFFSKFKVNYTIYASNEIKVSFSYKKPLIAPAPTVIGMRYKFYNEYDNFSYRGLGKEDTYIDRYKGVKYGVFDSKASEEYVDYSIPQECGNHEYTKEVEIPMHGNKLTFVALDNTFAFKYLSNNEFEIENAERKENLPKSNYNYLTIYAINKGVGGDNSWGARVHKPYLVKNKRYNLSYIIKIKE